jgi:hypothetical protein
MPAVVAADQRRSGIALSEGAQYAFPVGVGDAL